MLDNAKDPAAKATKSIKKSIRHLRRRASQAIAVMVALLMSAALMLPAGLWADTTPGGGGHPALI
jgi:hypothetical protein